MTCRNKHCVEGNKKMVMELPGRVEILESFDQCIEPDDQALCDSDFLKRIHGSGLPPSRLHLKKGAVVILIRNLNVKQGHCNGTRCIVKNISPHFIEATKLDGGDAENGTVFIPKIPMKSKESDFPVLFTRLQFPVIGGHHLTFNKAQGQPLDHRGLLLPKSVFSHGHLCVGLSQTRDQKMFTV